MAVTTVEQETARLRSYLNPFIKGPNTSAVLSALATSSAYLVNNVQAVNDSLYIVTAQQGYLDLLLADYGITRDPTIGLSDSVFREVGIAVKNRKQVRDLINGILDAIFADQFVKATDSSQTFEPYALEDGDTLIINFDGATTNTITFHTAQFANIAAATALEIANAITVGLSNLNVTGSAVVANNGNGNYVQLVSGTIGASSSVTVLGGRVQNVLLFDATTPAAGNFSTQWTISKRNGGILRFTWTGGGNPNIGLVEPQEYVNIFGGGFASGDNQGTFVVTASQGGTVGNAYFEISNPNGSTGVIAQGIDSAIMFFTPLRKTVASQSNYAAVYQTEKNILQIFMPATTQAVQRNRIGSAHIHGVSETPVSQFILPEGSQLPTSGDAEYFLIDDQGDSYLYYFWLNTGSNTDPAPPGFTGIEVSVSSSDTAAEVASAALAALETAIPAFTYTIVDNVITLTLVDASTDADALGSGPNTLGPYIFDVSQDFVIGDASTTLTSIVNGETGNIIFVNSSAGFPNSQGYIVIGYGMQTQEVIPYIAVPSSGAILISPAYFLQQVHEVGDSVLLVSSLTPIALPSDGSDYQPYLTDDASARVYAQDLINQIVAAGVTVIFVILFPNPIGIGGWQSPIPSANEISYIYGP